MPPDAAATSNLRERDRVCVCRCMMSSYELGYLTLIRIVEGDSQSAKALNCCLMARDSGQSADHAGVLPHRKTRQR